MTTITTRDARRNLTDNTQKRDNLSEADRAKVDSALRELFIVLEKAAKSHHHGTFGVKVSRHAGTFRGIRIIYEREAH